MKNFFTLVVLILFCNSICGQVMTAYDSQLKGINLTDYQRELIYNNIKILPNKTQISLAIIKNGNVEFYGVERKQDSVFSVINNQSVFEIGSITKVFTCTLLSNLVLENKIKLDANINGYLNYQIKDSVKITFKQLANHTAGLPRLPSNLDLDLVNPKNPYKEYGEEELKDYMTKELQLLQTPGTISLYSNLSVGLLGYVLTQIENRTYEDLLQSYIFSKYNMSNSTTIRKRIQERLVPGLDENGEITLNWDMSILAGAGGILSTVEDLSKFAVAQFDNSHKELELTKEWNFKVNDNMELGLGWALIKTKSGSEWLWHNGGTGGYSSSIILNAKNTNGIVILSNVSAYNKSSGNISNLCADLMESMN